MADRTILIEKTSDIIAAFVSHNTVRSSELPEVIASVHKAIAELGSSKPVEEPAPELKPAVPIKKSVTHHYIISLETGQKLRMLSRHLGKLGMTPDQYRQKWGLPSSYPMVAPAYAAQRSERAKAIGFGQRTKGQATASPVEAPAPAPVPPPDAPAAPATKRRGRPKKAA
jgi:predicted transcriptional regulator